LYYTRITVKPSGFQSGPASFHRMFQRGAGRASGSYAKRRRGASRGARVWP